MIDNSVKRVCISLKQAGILFSPARLRKNIEWVSLMLRLSSRTSVFPSASAQCNTEASDRSRRTLLSRSPNLLWVIVARFLDADSEPVRFVCTTAVSDAILLQKRTSALAVDLTLTPTSSQSQRGTRHPLTTARPMGWKIYYKTDTGGSLNPMCWIIINK